VELQWVRNASRSAGPGVRVGGEWGWAGARALFVQQDEARTVLSRGSGQVSRTHAPSAGQQDLRTSRRASPPPRTLFSRIRSAYATCTCASFTAPASLGSRSWRSMLMPSTTVMMLSSCVRLNACLCVCTCVCVCVCTCVYACVCARAQGGHG